MKGPHNLKLVCILILTSLKMEYPMDVLVLKHSLQNILAGDDNRSIGCLLYNGLVYMFTRVRELFCEM